VTNGQKIHCWYNKSQSVNGQKNISIRQKDVTMTLVLRRPTAAVLTSAAELLTVESQQQLYTQIQTSH